MKPNSPFAVAHRCVRFFQSFVGASALAVACLCSLPVLAQAPAAAPAASAPAPVGNVQSADNAAQTMSPTLGSAVTAANPNPYGLRVAWGQGDTVTRTTLILLVLMSLLSWYVIVSKLLEQRRQAAQALAARTALTQNKSDLKD